MFKFFPLISLTLVGILYIIGSSHLTAGFVFFIIQLLAMGVVYWLIKKLKEKDIISLLPIMNQFKGFFAFSITIWIALAIFGFAGNIIGRIYSIGALIVFLGLSTSLTHQIFVTSDLLASYFDENNDRKDDKYDKRNR